MRRNDGFTLIELIVVIIILGLLAATAVPKFINLQKEARASTLKGVKGAMESASSLIYSKSVITGVENTPRSGVSVGSSTVTTAYGYPTANAAGIVLALDMSTGDWASGASATGWSVWPSSRATPAGCNVNYVGPGTAGARPIITVTETGC